MSKQTLVLCLIDKLLDDLSSQMEPFGWFKGASIVRTTPFRWPHKVEEPKWPKVMTPMTPQLLGSRKCHPVSRWSWLKFSSLYYKCWLVGQRKRVALTFYVLLLGTHVSHKRFHWELQTRLCLRFSANSLRVCQLQRSLVLCLEVWPPLRAFEWFPFVSDNNDIITVYCVYVGYADSRTTPWKRLFCFQKYTFSQYMSWSLCLSLSPSKQTTCS